MNPVHFQRLIVCSFTMALLLAASPDHDLFAQGSAEDYERATRLRSLTRNRVTGLEIDVTWSADESCISYQQPSNADSTRFMIASTETGEVNSAFEDQAVAEFLVDAGWDDIEVTDLPVRRVTPIEWGIVELDIRRGENRMRLRIANGDISALDDTDQESDESNLPARRPSRRVRSGESRTDSSIEFVNQLDESVRLFWIDSDGNRVEYETLDAGESFDQHTFASHAWLVTKQDETPLMMFVATASPSRALISDATELVDGPNRGEGRPRQRFSNNASPDGRWTFEIRDHNVFVRDNETDELVQLSQDGNEDDSYSNRGYWSPDSSRVVVMQTQPSEEHIVHYIESSPRDQQQPILRSYSYLKPGDRIAKPRPRMFDVASGESIPIDESLFDNPWRISNLMWADDSSRFLFLYNQRGHQVMRVVSVDATTGVATALIDENMQTFFDYSNKTYLRYLSDTEEIVWMSERSGWNHLYLIDALTGDVKRQITEGEWLVRDVVSFDQEKRELIVRVMGNDLEQDPYHVHFARVHLDDSEITFLTDGDGTHQIEFSPSGRFLIDTYSRVDLPPVHELRDARTGSFVSKLHAASWEGLRSIGWQLPERFVTKGRDGETDIWGMIFRPTTFDPDRKYPIIEAIYAGPHGHHVPKSFRTYYSEQALAELGFIVVKIDGMGTNWRSKAFHDYCWKNIGDAGFPDRKKWITAAADLYPYMDLSRVGIYGGSAGGQNAMRALIDHNDFYHVAVADCGCHDNRMDKIWWNEAWMGWPIDDSYSRSSNVDQAHRMEGHLLLTVGEADSNVDPASTMQVVDALIRADKDFDLIVFPGRGHGAGSSAYGTRRLRDFFVRHLHDVEPRHSSTE